MSKLDIVFIFMSLVMGIVVLLNLCHLIKDFIDDMKEAQQRKRRLRQSHQIMSMGAGQSVPRRYLNKDKLNLK